jgi:sugar-specific transcriptional regulator TrmB
MPKAAALLQELGFSDYEARAYVALLQRSPLNGYELAKASGLPRANVYSVLQKLEERGAVVRHDSPSGVRYAPVPPAALTGRLGDRYQSILDAAQRSLDEISSPAEHEYVWNARGYTVLLEQARERWWRSGQMRRVSWQSHWLRQQRAESRSSHSAQQPA